MKNDELSASRQALEALRVVKEHKAIFQDVPRYDLTSLGDMYRGALEGLRALEELRRQTATTVRALSESADFKQVQKYLSGQGLLRSTSTALEDALKTVLKDHEIFRSRLATTLDEQNVSIAKRLLGASEAWREVCEGITGSMKKLRLYESHPLLSAHLLRPAITFREFASDTLERLDTAKNGREAAALERSLTLAEEQLVQSSEAVESFIAVPEDADSNSPEIELNLFKEQQNELLDVGDETALQQTASGRVYLKIKEALELIVLCNHTSQQRTGSEIFKPTTRALGAFAGISYCLVSNSHLLESFVTNLYVLIYEGAGTTNLRFLKDGLVTDAECRVIWALKDLRNKWLLHDPDHGKGKEIEKKWSDFRDSLEWLNLRRLPMTKQEYIALQYNLLDRLTDFLRLVVNRLSQK